MGDDNKRNGGRRIRLAAVFTILIALASVINIAAQRLGTSIDLTPNRLYSLSDYSKKKLSSLEHNIDIYAVFERGTEEPVVMQVIKGYAKENKKIRLNTVSPLSYLQEAPDYGGNIQNGSIVVSSGSRYKIIAADDILVFAIDEYTGTVYADKISLEAALTGAIAFVSDLNTSAVYYLEGHDETPLDSEFKSWLEYANAELKALPLYAVRKIPDDAEAIIINAPLNDITEGERILLEEYYLNGGSIMLNAAIGSSRLEQISELMDFIGVSVNNAMVIESDSGYMLQGNPYYLSPRLTGNNFTSVLSKRDVEIFFPYAQGILSNEEVKSSALIVSSESSYGKKNVAGMDDFQKAAEDLSGPFNLAVAIEGGQGRAVVVGGEALFASSLNLYVDGGNFEFLTCALNWLTGNDDLGILSPKPIERGYHLNIPEKDALIIVFISVVSIPVLIIAAGAAVVWSRKRK